MPKIVITFEYKPNLDDYPSDIKTTADAMRYDVENINDYLIDDMLRMDGELTFEVVE